MNNELTLAQAPTLVAFTPSVDLVEIRRHPERFPRIGTTPRDIAVEKMTPIVYASFLYRGQDVNEVAMDFIASALVDEIMADHEFGLQALSWMEIGMAIRKAVLGAGKELYGVSVSSLYAALVDYAKNEGHEACKKANQ